MICDEKRGEAPLFLRAFQDGDSLLYLERRNTRKGSTKERTRKKNRKIAAEFSGEKRIYKAIERPEGTDEKSRAEYRRERVG